MNNSELLKALDNENNKGVMKLSSDKIYKDKNDIFDQLYLTHEDKKIMTNKLNDYIYVDDLDDIKIGSYLRWINIKDADNIKLTNGGLLCEIKYLDDGCHLVLKNNFNRLMQINMEQSLIFQKLNNQEKIILNVIDYLNK